MTITTDQADTVAEALLDDAAMSHGMVTTMWRVASSLGRIGASHAELDAFIAAMMFSNALLRIRESMDMLELWECAYGPCPACCVDCDAATGGYCRKHVPPWESDRGMR